MKRLVVVENAARWPFELEGAEVVAARDYLTEARYAEMRSAIVFNVCRTYRYQSFGYYVSLLATARRHRPPGQCTFRPIFSRPFGTCP